MANYIVLTSKNRKLSLPLSINEMDKNEDIVSTNAPYGMLFVVNKLLKSYFTIEKYELEKGSLVCVPLIEDYKAQEKNNLLKKLEKIEKI
jgi:hypothetical protein